VNDLHDLQLLLHSRFPILVVETQEEARLLALLERVCGQERWPLYQWSVADGLRGRGTALDTTLVLEELQRTRPLSVVMATACAAAARRLSTGRMRRTRVRSPMHCAMSRPRWRSASMCSATRIRS
jgi:hypothetical protein